MSPSGATRSAQDGELLDCPWQFGSHNVLVAYRGECRNRSLLAPATSPGIGQGIHTTRRRGRRRRLTMVLWSDAAPDPVSGGSRETIGSPHSRRQNRQVDHQKGTPADLWEGLRERLRGWDEAQPKREEQKTASLRGRGRRRGRDSHGLRYPGTPSQSGRMPPGRRHDALRR